MKNLEARIGTAISIERIPSKVQKRIKNSKKNYKKECATRKLTDSEVIFMRKTCHEHSVAKFSTAFGVSRVTIYNAIQGETFKYLNNIAAPVKLSKNR